MLLSNHKDCIDLEFRSVVGGVLLSLAVCSTVAAVPQAQPTNVRAISWDLSEVTGSLELLDEERVSIRRSDGSNAMLSPKNLALIEFTSTLERANSTGEMGDVTNGLLRLVDGTRYTGWSEIESGNFVWRNWWAGTVRPSVDDIVSFIEKGRDQPAKVMNEDVLVLQNGDRVEGLVAAIGSDVEIERPDGATVKVPLDRVDSLALVNPLRPEKGTRAWLVPGDEVDIQSYRFDPGTGLRVPDHEALMSTYISSIAFDVGSIKPLADMPADVSELPGMPRYRVPEPILERGTWALDAPPINLSGPMRVEWSLPKTGMGFVARAVLPRRARRFGDLELVVFDGEKPAYSVKLDRKVTEVELAVRLETTTLAIEIREGGMGPIQDEVRLERALVFSRRK